MAIAAGTDGWSRKRFVGGRRKLPEEVGIRLLKEEGDGERKSESERKVELR